MLRLKSVDGVGHFLAQLLRHNSRKYVRESPPVSGHKHLTFFKRLEKIKDWERGKLSQAQKHGLI